MTRKLACLASRPLDRHVTAPDHPSIIARMALAIAAGGAVLGASGVASAQELGGQFPFPSTNVASGVTTDALTTHELRQLYLDWREALVEQCPQGDARVRYPETQNDTRSEGIGYGMVIAAYMGDQPTLDGLWRYYQRTSTNGLMNWKRYDCGGQSRANDDNGSAADADIDAAFALIVADRQFPGSGYADDAVELLGAIRGELFNPGCQGVLLAGSQFGGCDCINPSYIPPGYYVAYGDIEQQDFWNQARDASYTYFNAARNPMTGLVPAWSQVNGALQIGCSPQVAGGGATSEYQADAARTPWRVAMDYQWTGDARAQDFLQSIGGFAAGQDIMRIRDRYTLAGQRANPNELSSIELGRNTYVMGGFATAMVAGTQQQIDDFTGAWISVYKAGDNFGDVFRAFNNSLALLYGLVVTGTMWSPSGPAPTAIPEAPLTPPTTGNLIVNGDFDEGVTGWEANSGYYDYGNTLTFTTSDGFALHQNGEMVLRVVSNEPASPGRLSFQQTVNLQAGRYLLSVSARSSAARAVSLSVRAGDETVGSIATAEDGTFTVDATERTYQTVFEVAAGAPDAAVRFEFGQASQDVVIDNVVLAPTDLPVDPGSAVGGPAPVAPGTPGAPGTPPGGGTPAPNDGTLGGVTPVGQDQGGAGVTPPLGTGGGIGPATNAPPPANAGAPSAQNCAPAAYSPEINLCFDPATGLVWDPSQNTYTLPPTVDWCGADENNPGSFYYWWPLLPACYDASSGYAFNPQLGEWVFVGTNFVRGQRGTGSDDGGCSIGAARGAGAGGWTSFALLGLAGAAVAMRRRR